MSQVCEMNGTKPFYGNNVSHSNRKTRARWMPNLKDKKYLIPELGQVVSLRLSTRAIRTIDKFGSISNAIVNAKVAQMSDRLKHIQAGILKARRSAK